MMTLDAKKIVNGTSPFEEVEEAERSVQNYLETFLTETPSNAESGKSFQRVVCCNSSRSFYCEECCRLLVPDDSLPIPISRRKKETSEKMFQHSGGEGRPLRLPFNVHVILDDRRKSATGLHAVALLNKTGPNEDRDDSPTDSLADHSCSILSNDSFDMGSVKLFDLATDDIPRYIDDASTFLLFPSPGESVPLESVASKVRTLVVLDCKWTSSGNSRKNKGLSSLQKVHLSSPPKQSYYWRWHNAGRGMLSTIEAIYFAAYEASQIKYQLLLDAGSITQSDSNDHMIDQNNLIHLLWLFGHQRAATIKSAQKNGVPAPCTGEGKELQRALRKQKGTWRQLRHKEDERRLKEKINVKEAKKQPFNAIM
ncbi:hypothetical protein ACHAW5_003756 [Stephanodiscus triporus]|uniref:tRNA-uridine aminocarboxypropyltransferase 1 n=1 Tax=Stephanodiscus triporus TaxID=2934178 RepID=A0ABD3NGM4_9STRA